MNKPCIHKAGVAMPRTVEANQRLREAQQAKILEGARKAFTRKGWAATMTDVAAASEVSQGLAYRYFANKEVLVRTLIEQAIQDGPTRLQRFLERPGTPGERLAFLVSWVVDSRSEHPDLYQLLDQVCSDEATPSDLRELIYNQIYAFLDVLRQLVIEGQASGEVAADDPDQLVTAVIACLGFTRWALRDSEQVKKRIPDARIILRVLKPDQE
jgi:AcrR family transcriptional regulator